MAEAAWKQTQLSATPGWRLEAEELGDITLTPVNDLSIITVAFDPETVDLVAKNLGLGSRKLKVGASVLGPLPNGSAGPKVECRYALLQAGQLWLMARTDAETLANGCRSALKTDAWLTDQSDGWTAISVAGTGSEPADALHKLASRLTMLDVPTMETGSATRTLIVHMGAIVVKQAQDRLMILVARSNARDMADVLRQAARYA